MNFDPVRVYTFVCVAIKTKREKVALHMLENAQTMLVHIGVRGPIFLILSSDGGATVRFFSFQILDFLSSLLQTL